MNHYKTTFKTWNKIASLYEEIFMDMELYTDTYTIFCNELIQKKPAILEIGCGPGNITKHVISKIPDCNVLGIDIAPNMISLAKKNNPTAKFKVMDGRKINTISSKFDGIISGFYLPYLSQLDCLNFIKDCSSLLNINGVLYISFVEGDPKDSGYQTGSTGDEIYFNYHHLNNLKKELIQHDFAILKVIHKQYSKKDRATEIHTIIIAEQIGK